MMKRCLSLLSAVTVGLGLASPAAADPHLGAGYKRVDFDEVAFNALGLRAGTKVFGPFGVEGEAFFGIGDDEETISETNIDFSVESSLNYQVGGFATVSMPVLGAGTFGARLGASHVEIEAEALDVSVTEGETGVAYGVYFRYGFGGDGVYGVRADIGRVEIEDADITEASLVFERRF